MNVCVQGDYLKACSNLLAGTAGGTHSTSNDLHNVWTGQQLIHISVSFQYHLNKSLNSHHEVS
jgi:hypothetical protein